MEGKHKEMQKQVEERGVAALLAQVQDSKKDVDELSDVLKTTLSGKTSVEERLEQVMLELEDTKETVEHLHVVIGEQEFSTCNTDSEHHQKSSAFELQARLLEDKAREQQEVVLKLEVDLHAASADSRQVSAQFAALTRQHEEYVAHAEQAVSGFESKLDAASAHRKEMEQTHQELEHAHSALKQTHQDAAAQHQAVLAAAAAAAEHALTTLQAESHKALQEEVARQVARYTTFQNDVARERALDAEAATAAATTASAAAASAADTAANHAATAAAAASAASVAELSAALMAASAAADTAANHAATAAATASAASAAELSAALMAASAAADTAANHAATAAATASASSAAELSAALTAASAAADSAANDVAVIAAARSETAAVGKTLEAVQQQLVAQKAAAKDKLERERTRERQAGEDKLKMVVEELTRVEALKDIAEKGNDAFTVEIDTLRKTTAAATEASRLALDERDSELVSLRAQLAQAHELAGKAGEEVRRGQDEAEARQAAEAHSSLLRLDVSSLSAQVEELTAARRELEGASERAAADAAELKANNRSVFIRNAHLEESAAALHQAMAKISKALGAEAAADVITESHMADLLERSVGAEAASIKARELQECLEAASEAMQESEDKRLAAETRADTCDANLDTCHASLAAHLVEVASLKDAVAAAHERSGDLEKALAAQEGALAPLTEGKVALEASVEALRAQVCVYACVCVCVCVCVCACARLCLLRVWIGRSKDAH